ncbi:DNA topoisomerase [Lineolata rhizophorae]|uniref:DNA topoisomerase 2 n=1 Tax=Lineolata rhizophorae TaxID=578093 RepID=A0A6A6P430_9PEZI|nr:DNA topoisomerase [Lineolata rhizophorae]
MDDYSMESVFDDGGSSVFQPPPKSKKAAPKKTAAKPKAAAPKKTTQTTLTKATKATKAAPKKRAKPDSDDENDLGLNGEALDAELLSTLSNTPPSQKKQRKAPGPKKSSGKTLQDIANESFSMDAEAQEVIAKAKKSGNATDRYQRLSLVEHILKRPDTYIGSVERTDKEMWVFNSSTESMERREISYVPGLYKIFDEILVNAADNKVRDKNMNEIKVTVDREKGEISVRNNGKGIPIEIHEKEKMYVPELIFGNLLTGSNFDDDEQKVTGGRNGYGAKLCNVFSTEFTVETLDSRQGKKYRQTWTDNMANAGKPKITSCKGEDYTKVTFTPDFGKFGMTSMDDDFEALVKRRVYDLAGTCSGVKVSLNSDRIKINSFKRYMEMYTKEIRAVNAETDPEAADGKKDVIIIDRPNDRWEIGFAVSDGSFQQVSFVNSIATTSGGTHVNYVADQIVSKLVDIVKKKNKGGVQLKNNQIRNHIFLFVNCQVVNPAFTSQTKEQLTTKSSQFGSKCTVSDKFLNDIKKTEVINNILHFAAKKADQVLQKSDGSRRQRMNNAKLTDANRAGTKDGYRCTLILTEGDSASLLALAGRAVVDPDLFGVFPLRGKLLNVRDASIDQISKNQEIQNIKKFIGLQHKKEYTDTRSLRYGHLMIMTDQDHDGSHIKGLLINFLQVQFPSLLKIEGFLLEFITPIVKVWKGDPAHPKQLRSFFTMPEYEAWKKEPGHQRGWDHRYFKGLGTSSPEDAQVYFRDLDRHLKEFHTMKDHEAEMIDLAFSKKKADARKNWLRDFVPGTFLDMKDKMISYDDFVNKELILFSMADNLRSIPSVIDGFKPSQRKVLYTCFKLNLKKDAKVVQLAGTVSGLTNYSYGEASLQQTIIGLAQTFVGSNNVNCLHPSGNFGSRLQGGSDAASARYTYTRLSPFARKLFHASDEPLLSYEEDDGKTIEPQNYVPILPMILVNGADGIGTGWSSQIPNYKPEDIIDNLKRRMSGSKEDMTPMKPWFRGWTGEVEDLGGDRYKFSGTIRRTGPNEVEITELPIRVWTQDFKERLEEIIRAEKVPSFIKDYTEYNTPEKVHFIIKMDDKHMSVSTERGLEETFKLSKTLATTNLVAFDAHGRIHKYATVLDIMEEFYHVRLQFYEMRKQNLLNEMQKDLEKLTNQARFVQMIIDGKLVVSRKKKAVLVAELKRLGFKPIPKVADARKANELEPVVENEEEQSDETESGEVGASDYDYLLGMAIWSLTQERVAKLLKQIGDKEEEIDVLIKLSPKDLWTKDLDDFLEEWHAQLDEQHKRSKKIAGMGRRTSAKLGIKGGVGKGKKRKAGGSDDSDSDFAVKTKKPAASRAAPKTNALTNFLSKSSTAGPSKPPEPVEKKSPEDDLGDKMDVDPPGKSAAPAVGRGRGRPAGAKNKSKEKEKEPQVVDLDDEDDDEDIFTAVASEAKQSKAATSRRPRAAASKPAKYTLDDDSDGDNGDDLLGDVSAMVKGIGSSSNENSARQFFSTSARPSSSHGLTKNIGRSTAKARAEASDVDIDDTDYTKLVPQPSPQRPAARNARETILSGDEDEDDFALSRPKPKTKMTSKPAATKPAAKASTKPAPAPKKPTNLSPAAKAYAAKQAKGKDVPPPPKPTFQKKPKKVESEDEDDVSALANELLSDDDDEPEPAPKAARPGRRAAASKPKYVIDQSDEDESEADFDDDESD